MLEATLELAQNCVKPKRGFHFTDEHRSKAKLVQIATKKVRSEMIQAGSTLNRSHENKIRGFLTKALLSHAQKLCKANHKLDLKDTIEASAKLFGWGKADQPNTLLQIGVVEKLDVLGNKPD